MKLSSTSISLPIKFKCFSLWSLHNINFLSNLFRFAFLSALSPFKPCCQTLLSFRYRSSCFPTRFLGLSGCSISTLGHLHLPLGIVEPLRLKDRFWLVLAIIFRSSIPSSTSTNFLKC